MAQEMMNCPFCGALISTESTFCPYCGQKIAKPAAPQQPDPAVEEAARRQREQEEAARLQREQEEAARRQREQEEAARRQQEEAAARQRAYEQQQAYQQQQQAYNQQGADVVVEEDFQQMLTAYLTSLDMSDVAGEVETMRNKELN